MAGIAAATLTGNGYSAGSSNGAYTPYTQTFGANILVTVYLSTEVSGSGFAGYVTVVPNASATLANALLVAANFALIGIGGLGANNLFNSYPLGTPNFLDMPVGSFNSTGYSQSF
jgi:hypothetical protein